MVQEYSMFLLQLDKKTIKKILIFIFITLSLTACHMHTEENNTDQDHEDKLETITLYRTKEIGVYKTYHPENRQLQQYDMNDYQISLNDKVILKNYGIEFHENDQARIIIIKDDKTIYDNDVKVFLDNYEDHVYRIAFLNLRMRADLEEGLNERYVIKIKYNNNEVNWRFKYN